MGLQEEDETFRAWKNALAREELDRSASRVEMLEHNTGMLRRWAVSSRDVPIRTLLNHVQKLLSEPHVSSNLLVHVAMNANLGGKTPEAEQLVKLLLAQEDEYVDGSLASNPDLPPAVLRTLALNNRARDEAKTTLWQVYGETP